MNQQSSNNKIQPTSAQLALIHVAQSAGLSALVTLLTAVAQYLASGNVDLRVLLTVLGGGFLTGLTMVWKTVSSNPVAAQAALDTAQEALQKVEQLAPWLASDINKLTRPASPLAQQNNIAKLNTAAMPAQYPAPQAIRQSTPPVQYAQQGVSPQYIPQSFAQQSYPAMNLNQSPAMSFLQEQPAQQSQQQQG